MFARYQGHIGAYLVLAGADSEGGHLYSIHAHGSTDKTPYTANGSGMLAAMAVLETGWKPGRSSMTNLLRHIFAHIPATLLKVIYNRQEIVSKRR